MTGITIYKPNEQPGERAPESAVYTLPDGSRVRVRAGGVIPEGAVPDADRSSQPAPEPDTEERKKPAPQNRAKKAAPENR